MTQRPRTEIARERDQFYRPAPEPRRSTGEYSIPKHALQQRDRRSRCRRCGARILFLPNAATGATLCLDIASAVEVGAERLQLQVHQALCRPAARRDRKATA